jgi:circadian clock protein KaiC
MALRLADWLKSHAITALYLSLQDTGGATGLDVSSIMDTWIVLRNLSSETDHSRRLHIVKARGMAHSNNVRRMEITRGGVRLSDLPTGTG